MHSTMRSQRPGTRAAAALTSTLTTLNSLMQQLPSATGASSSSSSSSSAAVAIAASRTAERQAASSRLNEWTSAHPSSARRPRVAHQKTWANKSVQESSTPHDNLPLRRTVASALAAGSSMVYLPGAAEAGRDFNLASHSMRLAPSCMGKASGLGLFTTEDYKRSASDKNERRCVGYMFGEFISHAAYNRMVETHRTTTPEQEAYMIDFLQRGVNRVVDISETFSTNTDGFRMLISQQCVMGYMNDDRGTRPQQSCTLELPIGWDETDRTTTGSITEFMFKVTISNQDMPKGSELFLKYHWSIADWAEVIMRRKKKECPSAVSSTCAAAASSSSPLIFSPSPSGSAVCSPTPTCPPFVDSPEPPARTSKHCRSVPADAVATAVTGFGACPDFVDTPERPSKQRRTVPACVDSAASDVDMLNAADFTFSRPVAAFTSAVDCTIASIPVPIPDFVDTPERPAAPWRPQRLHSHVSISDDDGSDEAGPGHAPDESMEEAVQTCRDRQPLRPRSLLAPLAEAASSSDASGPMPNVSESDCIRYEPDDCEGYADSGGHDVDLTGDDGSPLRLYGNDSDDDSSDEDVDDNSDDDEEHDLQPPLDPDSDSDSDSDSASDSASDAVAAPSSSSSTPTARVRVDPYKSMLSPAAVQKLPHYAAPSLTPVEKAAVQAVITEHYGVKDAATCVRVYNTLMVDWGSAMMCCARNRVGLTALPSHHPMTSIVDFITQRLDVKQYECRRERSLFKQRALNTITNRIPSASAKSYPQVDGRTLACRDVMLSEAPVCVSCFRAWTGISRSTFYGIKKQLTHGNKTVIDHRTNHTGAPAVMVVVAALLAMISSGIADTLPTCEGGSKKAFFQFPHTQQSSLQAHLQSSLGPGHKVSSSTLSRAIKFMDSNLQIHIGMAVNKNFMKCTLCLTFDNEKNNAKSDQDRAAIQQKRITHFIQVQAPRANYAKLRDQAKRADGDLWVLCTDGMDQAKTVLPHMTVKSHATDSLFGLPTHAVSTFLFGAPVPVMGFLNHPDIQKNSSLTVTNLHRAIVIQIESMLKSAESGVIVKWPKHLHIVFDNAVGENLNANVFHYLGALRHHNLFERISVGTLLVGHTHNINDQLFSVWSKYMREHPVFSLPHMMEVFRDNYHARNVAETPDEREIRLLQEDEEKEANNDGIAARGEAALLIARRNTIDLVSNEAGDRYRSVLAAAAAANAAVDDPTLDAPGSYDNPRSFTQRARSFAEPTTKRRPQRLPSMKIMNEEEDAGKPHMEKVPYNVDVANWLGPQHRKDHPLSGLQDYHEFNIQKDPDTGDTMLYMKFCVGSDALYDKHAHAFKSDGVMFRRVLPLFKQVAPLITTDPHTLPYLHVDTTHMRELVRTLVLENFFEHSSCTPRDLASLDATFDSFSTQTKEQEARCVECGTLLRQMAEIGVLSRPKVGPTPVSIVDLASDIAAPDPMKATAAECMAKYNAASAKRNKLQKSLHLHLDDPKFKVQHEGTIIRGWWTKLLNDVIPQLDLLRSQRPSAPQLTISQDHVTGLLAHPDDATAEERSSTERVQVLHAMVYGQPQIGHIGVFRASEDAYLEGKPPFWLAELLDYTDQSALQRADEEVRVARANEVYEYVQQCRAGRCEMDPLRLVLPSTTNFPPAPPTAAEKRAIEKFEWMAKRKRGKDQLHVPDALADVNTFRCTHLRIKPYLHREPAKDMKARSDAQKKEKKAAAAEKKAAAAAVAIAASSAASGRSSRSRKGRVSHADAADVDMMSSLIPAAPTTPIDDEEDDAGHDGDYIDAAAAPSSSSSAPAAPVTVPDFAETGLPLEAVVRWKNLIYMSSDHKDAAAHVFEVAAGAHWMPIENLIIWAAKKDMLTNKGTMETAMWNKVKSDLMQKLEKEAEASGDTAKENGQGHQ